MNKRKAIFLGLLTFVILHFSCKTEKKETITTAVVVPSLEVSKDGHYFQKGTEKPFFWLGDTGWLTFNKLDRAEIKEYFKERKEKGYNVIQIMTLHSLAVTNVFGDAGLVDGDLSKPLTTEGNSYDSRLEYDFWDHIDYALDVAEEQDLYLAMVPIWGTPIAGGKVTIEQAKSYATFLAERFKDRKNIIWLNGGDTFGNENTEIWKAIGSILKKANPDRLVTFHPRGRTDSSDDFHTEDWLDFNMFQSGHRNYDQDDTERAYGPDNFKYVAVDFKLKPAKPTLDGEPSYEGIPHGLHDTLLPKWKAKDLRRYAYWSVFAGAAGFTYGHSAVMQMQGVDEKVGAYGNKKYWKNALQDPGAGQMHHLKKLMLTYSYFDRIPDQSLIANQGEKFSAILATRGEDFALIYTYTGSDLEINMGKIKGEVITASWFNPKNGEVELIGDFPNKEVLTFNPPLVAEEGNDWVLILTTKA